MYEAYFIIYLIICYVIDEFDIVKINIVNIFLVIGAL